jgi:hypothetical protein
MCYEIKDLWGNSGVALFTRMAIISSVSWKSSVLSSKSISGHKKLA